MEFGSGFKHSAPPVPVPRIRKQFKIPKMPTEHSGINIQTAPRIMPPKRRKKSNTSSELAYIKHTANETEIEHSHFYSEEGLINKNTNADCNKVTTMNSLDTFILTVECPDRINNYFNFVKPKPYYSSSNMLYNAKTCNTQEDDDSGVYFAEITSLESQKYDQTEVKQNKATDAKCEGIFPNENNYSNNLLNSTNKQNSTNTNEQIMNTDTPADVFPSPEFDDQVDPYNSMNISQDSDNKNLQMNGVIDYVTSCNSKANTVQNDQQVSREDNGDMSHVLATSDIEFEEFCINKADCTMIETSNNLNYGDNESHTASAINSNDISEIVDRFLLLDVQDCPSKIPQELSENVSQQKCKLSPIEESPKTKEDPLVEISKKFSMFLCDMLGSSSLLNAVSDEVVKPLSNSHSLLSAVDNKLNYENSKCLKTSVNEHFKCQTFLKDKESKCDKYCTNDAKQNDCDHVSVNKNILDEVENRLGHVEEAHVEKDSENSTPNALKSFSIVDLTDQSCNAKFDEVLGNNNVENVNKSLEIQCSYNEEGGRNTDHSCNSHSSAVDESDISYLSSATEMQSKLNGGGVAEVQKDSEANDANNINVSVFANVCFTTEVSAALGNNNSNVVSENLQIECCNYVDGDKDLDFSPNFQKYVADNLETSHQPIVIEIESKQNLGKEEQIQKDSKGNSRNVKMTSVNDFIDKCCSTEPSVVSENSNSNAIKKLQTECSNSAEGDSELGLSCNSQNSVADNLQASSQSIVIERENKLNLDEEIEIQKNSEANHMNDVNNGYAIDCFHANSFRALPNVSEDSNVNAISEILETACYNYAEDNRELHLTSNSQDFNISNSSLIEGNGPPKTERGIGSVVAHDKLLHGNELENKNPTNTKKKSVKFNDTVNIINKVEYALQRNRSISIKEEKPVFKRESWITTTNIKSNRRESAENDSDDSENMVEEQDLWRSCNEELCEKPKKSCLPSFESFIAKSCGTVAIKPEEEKIHDHELWTSDNNQVNNCRNTQLPSFESFISKTSRNINTNVIQNADQTDSKNGKSALFESYISECEAHSYLPKVPTPSKCSTSREILLDATFWTKQKSSDNDTGAPKSEYQ